MRPSSREEIGVLVAALCAATNTLYLFAPELTYTHADAGRRKFI
jgi:hypothetical protein